jgi:hypothetical protein
VGSTSYQSSTSYTDDTGLSAGTTYYYKVATTTDSGYLSSPAYATTFSDYEGTASSPIWLNSDTWVNGAIDSSTTDSAVWYALNVSSGSTYYIWWNDSHSGDSKKTLDVKVSAYYGSSTGSSIFSETDVGWDNPQSFTPPAYNTTVYIKVTPYSSGTGTYSIVYSTGSYRPGPPAQD